MKETKNIIKKFETKGYKLVEVKKLYNDKARGKFKGNAKDWAQLEEQIMEAAASGRIL